MRSGIGSSIEHARIKPAEMPRVAIRKTNAYGHFVLHKPDREMLHACSQKYVSGM